MESNFQFIEELNYLFNRNKISFDNKTYNLLITFLSKFSKKNELILRYKKLVEKYDSYKEIDNDNFAPYISIKLTNEITKDYCLDNNLNYENFINSHVYNKYDDVKRWFYALLQEKLCKIIGNENFNIDKGNMLTIKKKASKEYLLFATEHSEHFLWNYISQNENLDWSIENISIVKNHIDWIKLALNPSIKWDFFYIDEFKDYLEWKIVKTFPLEWDINLLKKYTNYLFYSKSNNYFEFLDYFDKTNNFKSLEENTLTNWNNEILEKYVDVLDWKNICKNSSIKFDSYKLQKFENKIDFVNLSIYGNLDWNLDTLKNFMNITSIYNLIQNKNIFWTLNYFEDFILDNDHYTEYFVANANIDIHIIIKHKNIWKKRVTRIKYHRRNSEGTESFITTISLWELLLSNPNIIWNDYLLENCINNMEISSISSKTKLQLSSNLINKYWNFYHVEYIEYYEGFDEGNIGKNSNIYFRNYLKNVEITDLTIDIFKENEIRWYKILYTENWLNKSIYEMFKKQIN